MNTRTRPFGRAGIAVYLCSQLAGAALGQPDSTESGSPSPSLVYDNLTANGGLDPAGATPASQIDAVFPFDAAAADDFVLPVSPRCRWAINGVRWTGLRWGGSDPGSISGFRIVFWPDEDGIPAGGGSLTPDLGLALAVYHVPGNAGESAVAPDTYQYDATLPTPLELLPGVRYWIHIQAEINFPPQWGVHITQGRQGMPPVAYFDLLELWAWTPVPDDGDLAFQLLGTPVDIDCNDGNACTADACVNGACVSSPMTCDDGNACTADSCDVQLGCRTEAVTCDDQDACTTDVCDPASGCTSTPVDCTDEDPCTKDVCEGGVCAHYGPPDVDGDGDFDLQDFEALSPCFNGNVSTGELACDCLDINHDGRLDLSDIAALQRTFTGSR